MPYIDTDYLKYTALAENKDTFTFDEVISLIDSVKPADARYVIHAHWIDTEGIPVCSHCGHATDDAILLFDGTTHVSRTPYFCGKCGAMMDEEEQK